MKLRFSGSFYTKKKWDYPIKRISTKTVPVFLNELSVLPYLATISIFPVSGMSKGGKQMGMMLSW